jgi:hypothetical protein
MSIERPHRYNQLHCNQTHEELEHSTNTNLLKVTAYTPTIEGRYNNVTGRLKKKE